MKIGSVKNRAPIFFLVFMLGLVTYAVELNAAEDPDAQAYLAKAMQTPLIFSAPKAQSDEIWSRITSFMIIYLKGGPQGKITDSTATSGPLNVTLTQGNVPELSAYSAFRTVKGEVVEFSIQSVLLNTGTNLTGKNVYVWSNADQKVVMQNLHIWALYAKTGEIRAELVDKTH